MPPPTQMHDVRPGAQLGVGGQQQVVEVLPRVVPTGAATLDVDDDRVVGTSLAIRITERICATVPGLNAT